ncbi:RNA polymerase sigma-70 factor (ECF subfamily) [Crossiella equi]|uniref:RNA polymerase sigma-70 factor (ECF subfamily) n=1 Tax=Crossiella equi TaxID=130796 RepID=A0ABS5ASH4_9PSEU|nr:sigma factor-like helix-turn-helix DNA-binding protein [Crossiella equi]MBP2479534.1 RNA polymerase sigma-70 factor (ECF subfamily) [Crossiella equi]
MPEHPRLRPVQAEAAEPGPGAPVDAAALLMSAGRGDRAAFTRFHDVVIGTVWGIVRQVVRERARAEQVTESVMLAAWHEAAEFDPRRGSALAWVVARAHRAAVACLREDRVVPGPRPVPDLALPDPASPNLRGHQLRRHLATLTQEQRDCLVLAYYHGQDCLQIAAALDLPVTTVRTRLRDAMIRLRDCLGVT